MTDDQDITNRVIACLAKGAVKDPATIRPDMTFAEMELDSLDLVNTVFELEEEFKFAIEPGQEEGITSVPDLVAMIQKVLAEKAQGTGTAA